jgi:hypothetical protein
MPVGMFRFLLLFVFVYFSSVTTFTMLEYGRIVFDCALLKFIALNKWPARFRPRSTFSAYVLYVTSASAAGAA